MSRVYFHSPSGDAELHGSERAHLGAVCNNLAMTFAGLDYGQTARRLAEMVRPGHYMHGRSPGTSDFSVDPAWRRDMELALSSMISGATLAWKGQSLPTFSIALNTALAVGGDAVKLATRIHGQCEIHGYVEGPNRVWLADMMQGGLDCGLYRSGMWYEPTTGAEKKWSSQGWEEVITLLRQRADEPVVMSYSVCSRFPNKYVGDWLAPWPEGVPKNWDNLTEDQQAEREKRSEEWYDLEEAEQWRISLVGLRAGGFGGELKPDNWATFHYRHGLTFFDLLADDYAVRIDAADLSSAAEEAEW